MIQHHQETTIEIDDLGLEVTRLLIEIWLDFFGTWVQEDDVKYEMIMMNVACVRWILRLKKQIHLQLMLQARGNNDEPMLQDVEMSDSE